MRYRLNLAPGSGRIEPDSGIDLVKQSEEGEGSFRCGRSLTPVRAAMHDKEGANRSKEGAYLNLGHT